MFHKYILYFSFFTFLLCFHSSLFVLAKKGVRGYQAPLKIHSRIPGPPRPTLNPAPFVTRTTSEKNRLKLSLLSSDIYYDVGGSIFPELFTGHGPARGSGQAVRNKKKLAGRVGSGREVFEISPVGSGRIRSRGFQISRIGLGQPNPTRPARDDPTCEKPCIFR